MNTCGRSMTATFFPDAAGRAALRRAWRDMVHAQPPATLTAAHHLLYLALLGRDWRRAFAPISNPRTLANGGFCNWGLFRALRALHSRWAEEDLLAPFGATVSADALRQVRALVPLVSPADFPPEVYAGGRFPFSAYIAPGHAAESPASAVDLSGRPPMPER